jgi:hypothetical protein
MGCCGYSQFSNGEVALQTVLIHDRSGSDNPVTAPQTLDKAI